jgi:hypothetical protein
MHSTWCTATAYWLPLHSARPVAWAYSQHSRLLVQRSDEVVSSQSERQGDPLGPLLFALTLQGPLEQVV